MKYKSKWEPNSINKDFWREVLLGRTITDIEFDHVGISAVTLDNNEKLLRTGGPGSCMFAINCPDEERPGILRFPKS